MIAASGRRVLRLRKRWSHDEILLYNPPSGNPMAVERGT
jgi:hypothetical protein